MLARLAALGCLTGCCLSRAVLTVSLLATGALILAALGELTRTPWCWCTHDRVFHVRDRTESGCCLCWCPKYNPVITWRKNVTSRN